MPALPVRKKITDPKLAAEQAGIRAYELAVETGSFSLSPPKFSPMSPRKSSPSSTSNLLPTLQDRRDLLPNHRERSASKSMTNPPEVLISQSR
jgi:hypothetical protein